MYQIQKKEYKNYYYTIKITRIKLLNKMKEL